MAPSSAQALGDEVGSRHPASVQGCQGDRSESLGAPQPRAGTCICTELPPHCPPCLGCLSWSVTRAEVGHEMNGVGLVGVTLSLLQQTTPGAPALADPALPQLPPQEREGELLPGVVLCGRVGVFREPARHPLPHSYNIPGCKMAVGPGVTGSWLPRCPYCPHLPPPAQVGRVPTCTAAPRCASSGVW